MRKPLQITWHNLTPSPAVEADIRARAAKLEKFYDRMISCSVFVDAPHKHHHKGNLFGIKIMIKVPDKEIAITREPPEHHEHEDIYVVIHDAFDAATRKLQDYVRIRRGQVKTLSHGSKMSDREEFLGFED